MRIRKSVIADERRRKEIRNETTCLVQRDLCTLPNLLLALERMMWWSLILCKSAAWAISGSISSQQTRESGKARVHPRFSKGSSGKPRVLADPSQP